MKYVRKTAGYTWTDYKTTTEIAKGLHITQFFGQNTGMQKKWFAAYPTRRSKQGTPF
jgi:hypothetical protein